jgi:diketogulonate reductase-like aldo/keto reductase
MKLVTLPSGATLPTLGLGTWRIGERQDRHAAEVAAVRTALLLGYRLIDTAEMYGEGGAERVVGEALADVLAAGEVRRDDLTIVTKAYPHHASEAGLPQACARSLARLRLDRIDLYLLHWPGSVPLAETVAGFERLRAEGRIGHWGVSNFDLGDMRRLWQVPSGDRCATNQVFYALSQRGIEFDLLPWQRTQRLPAMAYCPIDQGRLASHPALLRLAQARDVTGAQLALAWVVSRAGVIAIPKSVREAHLRDNLAALQIELTDAEHAELERHFPPPRRAQPLAIV